MTAIRFRLNGADIVQEVAVLLRDRETEQAEFEAHLQSCAPCQIEVRELLETTALLGIAAAQPVPPALRAAVLDEVSRTRVRSFFQPNRLPNSSGLSVSWPPFCLTR